MVIIQGAFRDVSNALVAYQKDRKFRVEQEHLFESARDAALLSQVGLKAGTNDYLEVLTNEANSFGAELELARAQVQRAGCSSVALSSAQRWLAMIDPGPGRVYIPIS